MSRLPAPAGQGNHARQGWAWVWKVSYGRSVSPSLAAMASLGESPMATLPNWVLEHEHASGYMAEAQFTCTILARVCTARPVRVVHAH